MRSAMANYLLDTTTIIDYLNGRSHVVSLVRSLAVEGHKLGVCCINVAEVYSGLKDREREVAVKLLSSMEYYTITFNIARQAGEYRNTFARRGITLTTSDVLVAAAAVANQSVLLTANVSHYPMTELQVQELASHN